MTERGFPLPAGGRSCKCCPVPEVINISTYRFAELSGLRALRDDLLETCRRLELKGTILLAHEGINLFVAGGRESIDGLLVRLRAIPGLEGLEPKESVSDRQPFNRMLVRLKKEIISFGVEGVNPARHTSPKLKPAELKQWLDEGRPLTLLDTRNDYEVKLGTFKGAIDPDIRTFRGFPDAVRKLPADLKDQPVVMFCTGGIRCEKAGPFMELEGFKHIYQLDGGILKYFEEVGGDHYDGDCFVFDQRVGVDPALRESSHAVCFACLAPLDEEDQADPRHVEGKSCPFCFQGGPERMAAEIADLEAALKRVSTPLPGSVPAENRRPVHIPAAMDQRTLLDGLAALLPGTPRDEWERRCDAGRFVNYQGDVRGKDHVVRAGERVLQVIPPAVEPDVATDIRVLHMDEALIVIDKPAPLPMHSGGRYHRNTLQNLMNLACEPHVARAVHRLDANTTGVVVFARTRHFARLLQREFIEDRVEKVYLAKVHGHPAADAFSSDAPVSSSPDEAGTRDIDEENGLPARSDFRVIERLPDGTALLEARPRSGRTNQLRVHLWSLGHPIVGDPTYQPGGGLESRQTLATGEPPMCLHAWKLAIRHPLRDETMEFEAPAPEWAGR
ncbi:MAG: sulfurtransferase [Akkermansiaceae bacterium]|nr:sulfurtransferase [Akkermansiaceae bacterium]MCP5548547.1 sulfurtransferase [Akkermansiaceae bacterium]